MRRTLNILKKAIGLIKNTDKSGLTVIELVVFVGIGSGLIIVLIAMITSSFDISRREFEQGAITEKARKEIERMSNNIRNAQYVDCNLDSDTSDPDEHWLIEGDDYSITLYSNVDDDVEAEKIRYFIDIGIPTEKKKLKRGVTQLGASLCDFSGTEDVQVVVNQLDNVKGPFNSTPLFRYYTSGNDSSLISTPVVTLSSVLRVGMELHIEETDIAPEKVEIATDVVPRSVKNPPACYAPQVNIERYKYTSSTLDFADTAYNECQSYCMGTTSLPVGECCAWSTSFSWQGNVNWYVWASCQCEDTYLPPDLTPETVSLNGYTAFAKECLEGTRCGGQMGEPICDAGCLDGPGNCVCVCPSGWEETTACADGVDNDNDGTTDYNGGAGDPGCSSDADSSENDPSLECDDGIDNDNDTFVDFQLWGGDPNCADLYDNAECGPVEIYGVPQCSDGIDNECLGDGIDYNGGSGDPHCTLDDDNNEWSWDNQCDDGLDNDGDGTIDCVGCAGESGGGDSDCTDQFDESEFADAPPGPTYQCSNDIDDDGDGRVDVDGAPGFDVIDPGCIDALDDDESNVITECNDMIDNDADVDTDFNGNGVDPGDSDCTDYWDDTEGGPPPTVCNDDLDNDGDGRIDWDGAPGFDAPDPGCTDQFDIDESNVITECNDMIDNDTDGTVDFNGNGVDPGDPQCTDYWDNDESI